MKAMLWNGDRMDCMMCAMCIMCRRMPKTDLTGPFRCCNP